MTQTVVAGSDAPAVIGLVGTLIGATIAGTVNLWLAWVTRRNEARATARLVQEELDAAIDVVTKLTREGAISAGHREKLVAVAWEKGRGVLAHSLRREEWDDVREGYRALDDLQRFVDAGRFNEVEFRRLQKTISKASGPLTVRGRDQPLKRLIFFPVRVAGATREALLNWMRATRARLGRRRAA